MNILGPNKVKSSTKEEVPLTFSSSSTSSLFNICVVPTFEPICILEVPWPIFRIEQLLKRLKVSDVLKSVSPLIITFDNSMLEKYPVPIRFKSWFIVVFPLVEPISMFVVSKQNFKSFTFSVNKLKLWDVEIISFPLTIRLLDKVAFEETNNSLSKWVSLWTLNTFDTLTFSWTCRLPEILESPIISRFVVGVSLLMPTYPQLRSVKMLDVESKFSFANLKSNWVWEALALPFKFKLSFDHFDNSTVANWECVPEISLFERKFKVKIGVDSFSMIGVNIGLVIIAAG